ncbi:hypothetical protein K438DRAFT_1979777 [Mycena galopus ATCC 62051]|nr:hypothetical protein K438DRAFT_1979777 [Mycena galopus ATCC 62051]
MKACTTPLPAFSIVVVFFVATRHRPNANAIRRILSLVVATTSTAVRQGTDNSVHALNRASFLFSSSSVPFPCLSSLFSIYMSFAPGSDTPTAIRSLSHCFWSGLKLGSRYRFAHVDVNTSDESVRSLILSSYACLRVCGHPAVVFLAPSFSCLEPGGRRPTTSYIKLV